MSEKKNRKKGNRVVSGKRAFRKKKYIRKSGLGEIYQNPSLMATKLIHEEQTYLVSNKIGWQRPEQLLSSFRGVVVRYLIVLYINFESSFNYSFAISVDRIQQALLSRYRSYKPVKWVYSRACQSKSVVLVED